MTKLQDKNTRYFVEIDLSSLALKRCDYDQKENLDKGRQSDPTTHRLFITKGQYTKLITRCSDELSSILLESKR